MSNMRHCAGCERDLTIENFAWKNKAKGIYQRWCRECQARANKIHYQNNTLIYKNRAIERNNRVIAENRQRLYDYLCVHPCVDCGKSDIRVLEFDHIRGRKKACISRMLGAATAWETIAEEIAKCEVRCANCHLAKTNERGGWWRQFLR